MIHRKPSPFAKLLVLARNDIYLALVPYKPKEKPLLLLPLPLSKRLAKPRSNFLGKLEKMETTTTTS